MARNWIPFAVCVWLPILMSSCQTRVTPTPPVAKEEIITRATIETATRSPVPTVTRFPTFTSTPLSTNSPTIQAIASPTRAPANTLTQQSTPAPTHTRVVATLTPEPAPQLTEPNERASFAARETITLSWTWRPLDPQEYFQILMARESTIQDWACTRNYSYPLPKQPLGAGNYSWQIVVRRGEYVEGKCLAHGDVSVPSEMRNFTWRPESVPATIPPYP